MRKWKPTVGERYYYLSQSGTVNSTVAGIGRDTIFRIATGNYYKSYKKAHKMLTEQLIALGFKILPWGKSNWDTLNYPIQYKPNFPKT